MTPTAGPAVGAPSGFPGVASEDDGVSRIAEQTEYGDSRPETAAAPAQLTPFLGFPGILFRRCEDPLRDGVREPPECFHDLNLDRVVARITAGKEDYDLVPFFQAPLTDADSIHYRQQIVVDLQRPQLQGPLETFGTRMRAMRRQIPRPDHRYYELERQRWHLAAVETYIRAIDGLAGDLKALDLASRGLVAFRSELERYKRSDSFQALAAEAARIAGELSAIRYTLQIRDASVTVRDYAGEADYTAAVQETFRKFQQSETGSDRRFKLKESFGMNHVEAWILEHVALLNPERFGRLAEFCRVHAEFVHPAIGRFDREIQFYRSYLEYTELFRPAGLAFCLPRVSREKSVSARETFELALAEQLVHEKGTVVCNDFRLEEMERVLVITGPNQGGKTTFARSFGQLHYLARLGLPVPGREARLFLCDRVFTHFEREEDIATLRGKLEDDLWRIKRILDSATSESVVIINEIFSSTTLEDALELGRRILAEIERRDLLCVCVTFLDELAASSGKTVSMVAGIDPADPTRRTFRIERRAPDGLAYAVAIAEKLRVTHRWIRERLRR
jgi:DNA mismatch repair protein MutS